MEEDYLTKVLCKMIGEKYDTLTDEKKTAFRRMADDFSKIAILYNNHAVLTENLKNVIKE